MKIVWTEQAVDDLQAIHDYIARDSERYAARFISRLIEAAEPLREFPELGRRVPEAESEEVREVLVQSYRLIYRLEENRLLIVAVIHGSRDLARIEPQPWVLE